MHAAAAVAATVRTIQSRGGSGAGRFLRRSFTTAYIEELWSCDAIKSQAGGMISHYRRKNDVGRNKAMTLSPQTTKYFDLCLHWWDNWRARSRKILGPFNLPALAVLPSVLSISNLVLVPSSVVHPQRGGRHWATPTCTFETTTTDALVMRKAAPLSKVQGSSFF